MFVVLSATEENWHEQTSNQWIKMVVLDIGILIQYKARWHDYFIQGEQCKIQPSPCKRGKLSYSWACCNLCPSLFYMKTFCAFKKISFVKCGLQTGAAYFYIPAGLVSCHDTCIVPHSGSCCGSSTHAPLYLPSPIYIPSCCQSLILVDVCGREFGQEISLYLLWRKVW